MRLPLLYDGLVLVMVGRGGVAERDKFVEIVETDVVEWDEIDLGRFLVPSAASSSSAARFLSLSNSVFASCSSATPFLRCLVCFPKPNRSTHTFVKGRLAHHSKAWVQALDLPIAEFLKV